MAVDFFGDRMPNNLIKLFFVHTPFLQLYKWGLINRKLRRLLFDHDFRLAYSIKLLNENQWMLPYFLLGHRHLTYYAPWFRAFVRVGLLDPGANESLALRLAAEAGSLPLVQLFLQDKRADPRANWNEAHRVALNKGHQEVAILLMEAINERNETNKE